MLLFRSSATIAGMRYVATVLALVVVATAAAAEEWRAASGSDPQPIELSPSEPPAETAATLLELKRRPALPAPEPTDLGAKGLVPKVVAAPPPTPATKASPPAPVTLVGPAPRRPTLGAAPAPTPGPVAITPARPADDDDHDDDDDEEDEGGEDDD
jgi:hypothetical protein